jgi:uncharacterized protein (TIGR00725 family)
MNLNEYSKQSLLISIIGASSSTDEGNSLAYEVGRLVAERGGILLCGGLGGIMHYCAKGAYEAGGLTIGILPGLSHSDANPYIRLPLPTGLGYMRNSVLVTVAMGVIAIEGSFGTLNEISFSRIREKPLALLKSWEGIEELDPFRVSTPLEAVMRVMK